jgi:septal ring factor EnvC (AmiA/AmiB activator)
MSAPEDFDTRTAFGHLTEALDAQATVLQSLDKKQDVQATQLASIDGHLVSMDGRLAAVEGHLASLDTKVDAVVAQLRKLNTNIMRGFTQSAKRDGVLAERVDKLEADVAVLKRRAPRKR